MLTVVAILGTCAWLVEMYPPAVVRNAAVLGSGGLALARWSPRIGSSVLVAGVLIALSIAGSNRTGFLAQTLLRPEVNTTQVVLALVLLVVTAGSLALMRLP